MEEARRLALRFALENAAGHGGRALARAVLGKLVAEMPELRSELAEALGLVENAVAEVNELSIEEQRARLRGLGPVEKPMPERRRGLPELPEVDKYPTIVTRFAPNPNGPLHVGHVRAALLSYEYARRYGGKFILRFEDTNPANAMEEMYELIRSDLRWLGIDWGEEYVQSDRLDLYYGYAERLLEGGKAYVCTCAVGDFRVLRDSGKPCPCRGLPSAEHLKRWRAMLAGEFEAGQAVMRVKTDLRHPNPAVRDWPAFRVVRAPHPRVGGRYRVWPLYNFAVSVDDHELAVTHVIRGKEHEVNEQCQRTLFEHLDWKRPEAVQYGRLTLAGVELSKTKTMRGIRSGELSGYDDVRLGTIAALRRRGFLPETIRQVILEIGLTQVDAALSWESLAAYNRKLVDDRANRYFFVPEPTELRVEGAPELREVSLRLHPSHPERGKRSVPLAWENRALRVWIPAEDAVQMREGKIFRLKDLMNVTLRSKVPRAEADFHSLPVMEVPKIQWVSANAVEAEVLKPDGSRELGLAEPEAAKLGVGTIVQFERYGFVRIEAARPKVVAVYAHR